MTIFVSTTFYGNENSDLDITLNFLKSLGIQNIELGSTHSYRDDLLEVIKKYSFSKIFTHNFFPPDKNLNFVINLASADVEVRQKSILHAKSALTFASKIGAEFYTVHPGFLSHIAEPKTQSISDTSISYDFEFSGQKASRELGFQLMAESLRELIDHSKKCSVKLAIETEGSLTKKNQLLMESISEYDDIFEIFPHDLFLNLNLAHTYFAGICNDYKVDEFIERFRNKIQLVELSHNNQKFDEHLPLVKGGHLLSYVELLRDLPIILEFRNANREQLVSSIGLLKNLI